jgi:hypothetical protein
MNTQTSTDATNDDTFDWRRFGVNVALIFEANIIAIADDIAYANGWTSVTVSDGENEDPATSDDDVIRALRQSYPLAAVFVRMCHGAMVPVPELVTRAMHDCEPLPSPTSSEPTPRHDVVTNDQKGAD